MLDYLYMRIWHEQLIPKLCRQHLLAMWRESLGAYKIITENRNDLSYYKHPATKEWINCPDKLWVRIQKVRWEMLSRGYKPKEMPRYCEETSYFNQPKEWQTLEQQIEVLKSKGCDCKI